MRVLLFLIVCALTLVVAAAQQLPTTCYQGNNEVFDDVSATQLCSGAACSVSWRAQVDWAAQELLDFEVRIDDVDQCVSNYGILLSTHVSCTAIGGNTLSVSWAAFYRGGSTAVMSWVYSGENLTCAELALWPERYDQFVLSRGFDVVIGTPVLGTLSLLSADQPLPLSAARIECPLLHLPCQCTTGCAYTPDEWARNSAAVTLLWQRVATLPKSVCGLTPISWLAGTHSTKAYPPQVANVLAEWTAFELALANFHCVDPALPGDKQLEEAVKDACSAVERLLVHSSSPSHDCLDDTHDWNHEIRVLANFNRGQYANLSGPCSCSQPECASRFDDNYDDSADAPIIVVSANGGSNVDNTAVSTPNKWDTLTIVFFSLMLFFGCCTILLLIAVGTFCVFSTAIGPRGFRLIDSELDTMGDHYASGAGFIRMVQ